MPIDLTPHREPATETNYVESAYLEGNPDVAEAVAAGLYESGWEHFLRFGRNESRFLALPATTAPWAAQLRAARSAKYERYADALIEGHESWERSLSLDVRDDGLGPVVHALPHDAATTFGIVGPPPLSEHPYDRTAQSLIDRHANGLVLDCGADSRNRYFENVVNLEIVPYASTDIVAASERIPLRDATVDAVICSAVLEHVKRPWLAAREITRILKPGGDLYVAVPFLQPLHGYPNHFFNMTAAGLASLFEDFDVESHEVIDSLHPIWALTWILRSWRDGLPRKAARTFEKLRVRDLVGDPPTYFGRDFVRDLPATKRMELAAGTALLARKRR